jgi:hypothetical protein
MSPVRQKYVVVPGWVRSQYDGQEHHISAGQLMYLYGVSPADCVVGKYDLLRREMRDAYGGRVPDDWPRLYPLYDGNYKAPPIFTGPR